MTSKAIKKKVIEYIDHADDRVLQAMYQMLKLYEDGEGISLMSTDQKQDVETRSALYMQGKLKTSNWMDVKKRVHSK
jgi:hypothetical protein